MGPSITIFGTGGIGSVYAYILEQAGADFIVVCRSNYAAVKANGITIRSQQWGTIHASKFKVTDDVSKIAIGQDFIIVTSKCFPHQRPSQAEVLRPAVGPNTTIVILQNGINIEEEYRTTFPGTPIISGIVYLPASQPSPGIVEHGAMNLLRLGTYPSNAPASEKAAAETFADLIRKGGGTVEVYDDIQPWRWKKLLLNASWNPICALSNCDDVDFLKASPESGAAVASAAMHEVVALARVKGYTDLTKDSVKKQLAQTQAREEGIAPSMLQDVRSRKPTEVEAILGNTLAVAKEMELETPTLRTLYALLKGLEVSFARERAQKEAKGEERL